MQPCGGEIGVANLTIRNRVATGFTDGIISGGSRAGALLAHASWRQSGLTVDTVTRVLVRDSRATAAGE